MEKFTHYRFINSKTGNILYYLSINDSEPNHEERLNNRKQKLSDEKNILYEDIYYEECYK